MSRREREERGSRRERKEKERGDKLRVEERGDKVRETSLLFLNNSSKSSPYVGDKFKVGSQPNFVLVLSNFQIIIKSF